jgi:hypothetical protein
LCNYKKYLVEEKDSFNIWETHYYLFLNGYGIGYIIIIVVYFLLTVSTFGFFVPYRIVELIKINFTNENWLVRQLAQTLAGLANYVGTVNENNMPKFLSIMSISIME